MKSIQLNLRREMESVIISLPSQLANMTVMDYIKDFLHIQPEVYT